MISLNIYDQSLQEIIEHGLQGTGIPCTGCVSHTVYLAHGNSKDELQEEGTDTGIMQESIKKSVRKENGHKREKSQTIPN